MFVFIFLLVHKTDNVALNCSTMEEYAFKNDETNHMQD